MQLQHGLKSSTFIRGVHWYCDEWCRLCPAIEGCLVARMRNAPGSRGKSLKIEDIVAFTREVAAVEGRATPDLDAMFSPDPAVRATVPNPDCPLTQSAERYAREASRYLLTRRWTPPSSPNLPNPTPLDVIAWYCVFLAGKVRRAVISDLLASGQPDKREDALGCAKLGLVCIDRSRSALAQVRAKDDGRHIALLLTLLDETERLLERRFPSARAFVRPGLDDVP